jgi:hypothetical protein
MAVAYDVNPLKRAYDGAAERNAYRVSARWMMYVL